MRQSACLMQGSRGEGAEQVPPLKNHKAIGFFSNTGPDPVENHKAAKPAFKFGPSSACQRICILSPLINNKKKMSLTHSDKTFLICTCQHSQNSAAGLYMYGVQSFLSNTIHIEITYSRTPDQDSRSFYHVR